MENVGKNAVNTQSCMCQIMCFEYINVFTQKEYVKMLCTTFTQLGSLTDKNFSVDRWTLSTLKPRHFSDVEMTYITEMEDVAVQQFE